MKQCNNCANSTCSTMKAEFPRFRSDHRMAKRLMQTNCSKWREPENFKITIFEQLLVKQPNDAIALLARFERKFRETPSRKPGFDFVTE